MQFGVSYEIWAAISIIIRMVAYLPYFYEIIKRQCHPHAFSWFIWFVIDFVAFLVQYYGGAGAASYATLFGGLISLTVATLAWFIGNRDITKGDYISFAVAMSVLPLWYFAHSPLAVLLVVISVEFVGNFPTWRKATRKPYEERAYIFFFLGLASIFTILAIEKMTLENILYPIYLVIVGMGTALYIVWRNRVVCKRNIQ